MGSSTFTKEFSSPVPAGKLFKALVDILDSDNLLPKITRQRILLLQDKAESISYEVKFEATADEGCKVTSVSKYNLKPGAEIGEEQHKEAEAKSMAIFKAVEAYLLANPAAYA